MIPIHHEKPRDFSQFSSVTQLCTTLCDPMNHSNQGSLSITNSRSPPKPMSIQSVMPSNHLIFLFLPSIFPSIRVFSNESALCIRWPKYWSFSFNIIYLSSNHMLILWEAPTIRNIAVFPLMVITNYSNGSHNNNLVNHQVKDCIKLTVIIDFKFKYPSHIFFIYYLKTCLFNWKIFSNHNGLNRVLIQVFERK